MSLLAPQAHDDSIARYSARSRRHVVHLTSVHVPEDTRIRIRECRSLVQAGYRVTLVVPGAEAESVDGVRVVGPVRPTGRLVRMTLTQLTMLRTALHERADVYHFHDPELVPVGWVLRCLGRSVIYDVHEDLPLQIKQKTWIPGRIVPVAAAATSVLQRLAGRTMTHVVAATPSVARLFPSERTTLIHNYPLVDEFDEHAGSDAPYQDRDAVVVYIGGVSVLRGALTMIEAVRRAGSAVSRFDLLGPFDSSEEEAMIRRAAEGTPTCVTGRLSRGESVKRMRNARIGVALLKPVHNFVRAIPTKLFEYMAAGLPVVVSDFGVMREIVNHESCGILVDPYDPSAAAEAIRWLLQNQEEAEVMGQRGRRAVRQRLSWSGEAERLVSLYDRLTGITSSPIRPPLVPSPEVGG